MKTRIRKQGNKIKTLKDDNGQWVLDDNLLK